jgi:hypothetical protein
VRHGKEGLPARKFKDKPTVLVSRRLRCNGHMHTVNLMSNGSMVLMDHKGTRDVDLAYERMGGEVLRCYQLLREFTYKDISDYSWRRKKAWSRSKASRAMITDDLKLHRGRAQRHTYARYAYGRDVRFSYYYCQSDQARTPTRDAVAADREMLLRAIATRQKNMETPAWNFNIRDHFAVIAVRPLARLVLKLYPEAGHALVSLSGGYALMSGRRFAVRRDHNRGPLRLSISLQRTYLDGVFRVLGHKPVVDDKLVLDLSPGGEQAAVLMPDYSVGYCELAITGTTARLVSPIQSAPFANDLIAKEK